MQWNTTTYPGDDLAELPRGLQGFDGVVFDIRGVIQLQSQVWKQRKCPFPEKVEGIETLDYVSAMAAPGAFMVALTVQ